jgi:hypothetical protein
MTERHIIAGSDIKLANFEDSRVSKPSQEVLPGSPVLVDSSQLHRGWHIEQQDVECVVRKDSINISVTNRLSPRLYEFADLSFICRLVIAQVHVNLLATKNFAHAFPAANDR